MGGRHSRGYELFQELTVKAFLTLRPHADQLVSTVQLMLGTGLPSFKGEATIKRLKDRFALELNERQAADWMMGTIRNAHENIRSTAYDEFQRVSCRATCNLTLLTNYIASEWFVCSYSKRRKPLRVFVQVYPISEVRRYYVVASMQGSVLMENRYTCRNIQGHYHCTGVAKSKHHLQMHRIPSLKYM